MCGCGLDEWCPGGCPCGCDHGSKAGQTRQAKHFALQYKDMRERASDAFDRGATHERELLARRLDELRATVAFGRKPGFRQGFVKCWGLAKDMVTPRRTQDPSSPE